jgi:C-terminal processing protease CtpA/Prc
MNCFVKVLETLDDVHSHIMFNGQYYGFYHPVEDSVYQRILPLKEKSNTQTGIIQTNLLDESYVYVRVPSINAYSQEDINRYGQALSDSICKQASKKIAGFIIDLRLNTGGNMYPMLGGLHALLGEQVIGYETDNVGKPVRKWEIFWSNLFLEGYQVTQIIDQCGKDFSTMPVVVLIGPMTASSGSMTAIAFKQRPNTLFVGESTADGYTTSNGYFQFAPNLTMNFATNFVADRNMNVYRTFVSPDKIIEGGDSFDNLMEDAKIITAMKWLKEKSRH